MINKRILLLVILVPLFGCTRVIKEYVEVPQIKGIELKSFSAKQSRAIFELAVYNPNAFSLPVSGLTGDITLNQMIVGSIDGAKSDHNLAAYTTQKVILPILLNTNALIKAAKIVLYQGRANYHFNGLVDSSAGEIPFSKQGVLSMKELVSVFLR